MQFDQTLSDEQLPDDPAHDPNGGAIQSHELPSGELLLTFSPEWIVENDYQVGDNITFLIKDTGMTLVNTTAQDRAERAGAERV